MRTISRVEAAKMISAIGAMTSNSSPILFDLFAQVLEEGWSLTKPPVFKLSGDVYVEFHRLYTKVECQDACLHIEGD